MIKVFMVINLFIILIFLMLLIKGKSPWIKALSNRLLITCLIIEIVLYAVHANQPVILDIAIVFAILGFVDIQFLSVYLRKRGDL